jgi:hypothetical protein
MLTLTLLALAAGCSTTGKDGTRHYIVIGFGLVSVNTTNLASAEVYKMQVLGISASDMPGVRLNMGYASSLVVLVPANNSAILEISDGPFSPLKLK